MDIWPVIHDERKALAADLRGRSGEEWATGSLCGQWTVRDVLAHMTSAASLTPPAFFAKLIGSGFSFDKVQEAGVAAYRGSSPAETMSNFEAVVPSVKHPPGPADTWLGETIVHAEDIRRPLGIEHHYPTEAVVQVADFYKGSNMLIGSKRRIEGLTLRATDAEWSHGTGPEVSGPILSLVMAMTGRQQPLDDLTGDGVATLRSRSLGGAPVPGGSSAAAGNRDPVGTATASQPSRPWPERAGCGAITTRLRCPGGRRLP